ncbi:hypothetical protein DPMN_086550 [Dreissena polymorpha]|uniref:B box-type domain-containing protein n=1 Tax=Dreissena polymorpha TaxID=45954 RepID=A0A9D4KRE7_DREPO|nr:hypothetical protein DPMN_086550 [Dreissena polymorpha]
MAEKDSDLIYEICCGFCEDYTIKREATFYCKQCSEGFCHECVKYHNILFKTHSTYGREDKKKWSVAKAKLEALMLCEQHPDHRIELFCEDHSKLCCHLCHSHNHRQCSKINLIGVKAKAMHQKGDLRKCSATIELEQITIEHEIDVINKRLQRLRTTREKAHADIKLARYQLNDILDTLERNSVQSLNTVYETLQKSLHSHLSICLKAKDDLQLIKHSIKDIDDEKYLLSFVSIAKSMELVSKAQVMLKEMPEQKHSVVEFRSNKAIEQMLFCLSGLGDAIEMKQEGKAGEILKCNNKTMYDVHITRDVNYCDISGICELSSGYMLISDYSNCRVKLLDIEFKIAFKGIIQFTFI